MTAVWLWIAAWPVIGVPLALLLFWLDEDAS